MNDTISKEMGNGMSNALESSRELSINNDQLLFIAEQAEKRVAAINTVMKAALKMTTYLDWVRMGDVPYLQETGASKIARLLGVSWQIGPPLKIYDPDNSGHYSYQCAGTFTFAGAEIDAFGLRSTHDEFFIGKGGNEGKPQKKPQDVDERDVMQAAYTNCVNNGIKRIVPGLRNITFEHLAASGINTEKIKGFSFNSSPKAEMNKGTQYQKAEMNEGTQNQKYEIERMLKEIHGDNWKNALEDITTFKGRNDEIVQGKTDINKLTEKMVAVTYRKVKEIYGKWVAENGRQGNTDETDGNGKKQNQSVSMQ